MGTVIVGKSKYSGMPCASQEEAKQSAAAIMSSTMPVSVCVHVCE